MSVPNKPLFFSDHLLLPKNITKFEGASEDLPVVVYYGKRYFAESVIVGVFSNQRNMVYCLRQQLAYIWSRLDLEILSSKLLSDEEVIEQASEFCFDVTSFRKLVGNPGLYYHWEKSSLEALICRNFTRLVPQKWVNIRNSIKWEL